MVVVKLAAPSITVKNAVTILIIRRRTLQAKSMLSLLQLDVPSVRTTFTLSSRLMLYSLLSNAVIVLQDLEWQVVLKLMSSAAGLKCGSTGPKALSRLTKSPSVSNVLMLFPVALGALQANNALSVSLALSKLILWPVWATSLVVSTTFVA